MDGIYVFWYCNYHDDGAIAYYELEDNILESKLYNPPEWLNICYACKTKKQIFCNYIQKGAIEYKNSKINIISTVQKSFKKEGGGFEFKYYLQNIYDSNGQILIEDINKHQLSIQFFKWFIEKNNK